MTILQRKLYYKAKGPVQNDEDWWRLVFDTETNRLYVEHEWEYVDVRGGGAVDAGRSEIEIGAFLNMPEEARAHGELVRLLKELFTGKPDV